MEELDGYRQLAIAILQEAVWDWGIAGHLRPWELREMWKLGTLPKGAKQAMFKAHNKHYRYTCPRSELLNFFHSRWCHELFLIAGLPYSLSLEALGITTPSEI